MNVAYICEGEVYCWQCAYTMGLPDEDSFVCEANESDYPVFCGSAGDCKGAIRINSGRKIGAFLPYRLTDEGESYTRELVKQDGPLGAILSAEYPWID